MKIKKAILTLSGGFDSLYIQKTACASGKEEAVIFSCGRRDSNPHASRHQILSLARLPITPRPHFSSCKYTIIFNSVYLNVNHVKNDSNPNKKSGFYRFNQDESISIPP